MRERTTSSYLLQLAALAVISISALAAAGCGASGNTFTSPTAVSKCAVAFDAPGSTLAASGGTGSLTIKTERECQWSAQPDVSWLSLPSGNSGQGAGSLQFSAAANADPVTRTGGIVVNGVRATVSQAAGECLVSLAAASASFPQAGGQGSVDVRASSGLCTWTAQSQVDWISVTTGATGKGNAAVGFTVAPTTGPPRTGEMKVAGHTFTVIQSEGCTYAIAPTTYSAGSSGGSGTITLTTGPGCPWTAASSAAWITVGASSGNGPAAVPFSVAPTSGPSRTGTVTVAGQTFTVTQSPGCGFDVAPVSHTVDPSGGSRSVNVSVADGCAWAAQSNASWLTITSATNGNGPGTVTFSVAATTGPSRTGTLTIAGQIVTVVQGQGCSFAISPETQSVPSSGGTGNVAVTTADGCAWSATSNQSWISITSGGSGSGPGTVRFSVAATSGPARSGTLTIAGRTFTVNQGQGCTFSLSSTSTTLSSVGGDGSFDVRTADGCAWTASKDASWVTLTSGASGSGNGTVRFTATANTGPQRTATITAGGQAFRITQSGGCTFSIAPTSFNAESGGGTTSIAVTTSSGCEWTASSNASWIKIASGERGSGNGAIQLAIEPNSEGPREGTVTVQGQIFKVTQAGGCTTSLSPTNTNVAAAGGQGSFAVITGVTCQWSATANAPWVSVAAESGSGTGPGTVHFNVAANVGAAREGTISVGNQAFTIRQDSGCSVTVAPESIAATAAGGVHDVGVTTGADCPWTATSNADWITIRGNASGTGNATVQLEVQANSGTTPRSGTATVAGKTVTVNQDAAAVCTYALAPTSQAIAVGGGNGTFNVTAGAGCAWTATSNAAWVTISSGASGTGNGSVTFAVEANATGAARSATITVQGQAFTIDQAGS